MERRKMMTKTIISDSLKELMKVQPFDKITIRKITDASGVIRPTFYNYFYDKYAVLEWVFQDEIINRITPLFDRDTYVEGIRLMLVIMEKDAEFYRKAFEITGQNSFVEIVRLRLYELFMNLLGPKLRLRKSENQLITVSLVANHYAITLLTLLEKWLNGEMQNFSTEDILDAFLFLSAHSLEDYLA